MAKFKPNAVLLDPATSGLDAFGAVRYLRGNKATHTLPIIALGNFRSHDGRAADTSDFDARIAMPLIWSVVSGPNRDIESTGSLNFSVSSLGATPIPVPPRDGGFCDSERIVPSLFRRTVIISALWILQFRRCFAPISNPLGRSLLQSIV